jgi:hypothetical protein
MGLHITPELLITRSGTFSSAGHVSGKSLIHLLLPPLPSPSSFFPSQCLSPSAPHLVDVLSFSLASYPLPSSLPHFIPDCELLPCPLIFQQTSNQVTSTRSVQPSRRVYYFESFFRRYTFDSYFSINLKSEFIFVWGEMDFFEATTSLERSVLLNCSDSEPVPETNALICVSW